MKSARRLVRAVWAVYLAEDIRLRRRVAQKILPSEELIVDFKPSRDGKRFAVVRGTDSTEIILIKGF
jgi:hypothetical protein